MPRRYRMLLISVVVLAAAVVAAPSVYRHLELAPWWYPVVGVDVSNHQGQIDWDALAASGVKFAYIKATEGTTFRDKSFARNWAEAERVGIARGAYHFFRHCPSGADQARNFIETVPNDPKALPPVVDAEHIGPCTESATASDHAAVLGEFLDALERHFGRRPIVYTTKEFDGAILESELTRERFWVRSLVLPPGFREDQWVIWQYHNRGHRPGVTGPLDLNVFRGSREEFGRFTGTLTGAEGGASPHGDAGH